MSARVTEVYVCSTCGKVSANPIAIEYRFCEACRSSEAVRERRRAHFEKVRAYRVKPEE